MIASFAGGVCLLRSGDAVSRMSEPRSQEEMRGSVDIVCAAILGMYEESQPSPTDKQVDTML